MDSELLLTLLVPLVGFLGVLVGQVFVRGRELREMRRRAYVEWIRAARNMATWTGPFPPAGTKPELPQLERLSALNDLTAELGVVASRRVLAAAQAYAEAWKEPAFKEAVEGAVGLRQIMDVADAYTTPHRQRVLRAMRRDLFPLWLRREV